MQLKQLIEQLTQYDPNTEVVLEAMMEAPAEITGTRKDVVYVSDDKGKQHETDAIIITGGREIE